MKGKTIVILILVAALVLTGTAGIVAGSLMDWNFAGYFAKGGEDVLATRPELEDNEDFVEPTEPDNTLPTEPEITEPMPESVTLTIWTPMEDQLGESNWLDIMLEKFEAEHPEYDIIWELGVCHEGDALNKVVSDVSAAADVFFYASDCLGTFYGANALMSVGGQYAEQVREENSQAMIDTVTHADGNIYGFPMSPNTWFMYYDKSVYTEEDVRSLDTMLEKGKVAFPITNAWYLWSFYAAGGGTLFGEYGNDGSAGIKLGDRGSAVTKYLVNFANHPNLINDASGVGMAGLADGSINAIFTGDWDAAVVRDCLGDNFGVAVPPCINLDGEMAQMKSFLGSKAIGVNQQSQHPQIAMQLAAFLSSAEAQLLRYEMRSVIPAASVLADDAQVANDPVAFAVLQTVTYASVVQPYIQEMGSYWGPAGNFGAALWDNSITQDNYVEQTDLLEQALNNSGL